jgi:hypothetical protein
MCVTVWLEISGISKDELSHGCYCGVTDLGPEILNHTVTHMVKFICRYN